MQALIDFLDDFVYGPMNFIDRFEGLFKATYYRDFGHVFTLLRMGKGGKHSRYEVEKLLNSYGIVVYCRTFDATYHYFRVKNRQARWAEYLMLHAGIELHGPPLDPHNARYVAQHPAGWMPPPWSERSGEYDGDVQTAPTKSPSSGQPDRDDSWNTFRKLVDW